MRHVLRAPGGRSEVTLHPKFYKTPNSESNSDGTPLEPLSHVMPTNLRNGIYVIEKSRDTFRVLTTSLFPSVCFQARARLRLPLLLGLLNFICSVDDDIIKRPSAQPRSKDKTPSRASPRQSKRAIINCRHYSAQHSLH